MPLQNDYAEDFVQPNIIHISSAEADKIDNDSNDIRFRLPRAFNNVVAIELESYHIPGNMFSQFAANNYIDFRLQNPDINGGLAKDFSVALPIIPVVFNSPTWPTADLLSVLYESINNEILKDPDFGPKVDIVPLVNPTKKTEFICRTFPFAPLFPALNSTNCTFLFGTGSNKHRSAASILGFDDTDLSFVDITFGTDTYKYIESILPAQTNKFRYLDINIEEANEFSPFYRVFLPTVRALSAAMPENSSRVRLLTKPVRKLETLTISMRLPGGVKPFVANNYYFAFRIFELKSSFALPANMRHPRMKMI